MKGHPMGEYIRDGRTLIIANPLAQSGAARDAAERLKRFLELYLHEQGYFRLVYTERPRHAEELAAAAGGYRTVLALGGDGVIHEVVNGLMRIERRMRPALGIIPVGSGNDFAQTLGIRDHSGNDLKHLLAGAPEPFDVGRIEYRDADGGTGARIEHFIQTCSFGLDAAIALDTCERRMRSNLTGNALYTASGLNVFGLRYRSFPVKVAFDGESEQALDPLIFAIQNGPTYGSGFHVAPDADPADGLLDICYAIGPLPRALALPIFLSAKNGRHVRSKHVHLRRCTRLSLTFPEDDYPIQADGEKIRASRLTVSILPHELDVLKPNGAL